MDIPVVFTVTGVRGMMKTTPDFGVFIKCITEMDAVFLNTGTKPVENTFHKH